MSLEAWGALIVALGIAFLAVFVAGRQSKASDVRAKEAEDRVEAINDKKEIDNEVAGLDPGSLDKRFDRWMRDR